MNGSALLDQGEPPGLINFPDPTQKNPSVKLPPLQTPLVGWWTSKLSPVDQTRNLLVDIQLSRLAFWRGRLMSSVKTIIIYFPIDICVSSAVILAHYSYLRHDIPERFFMERPYLHPANTSSVPKTSSAPSQSKGTLRSPANTHRVYSYHASTARLKDGSDA